MRGSRTERWQTCGRWRDTCGRPTARSWPSPSSPTISTGRRAQSRPPPTPSSSGWRPFAASSAWWKSGVAPRVAMRPAGKARRPRISGIFEGGATQPGGMQRRPNAGGLPSRAAKRTLDVMLSGVGLVASAPLWAIIAATIKITDRGPVFFTQTRVGERGRTVAPAVTYEATEHLDATANQGTVGNPAHGAALESTVAAFGHRATFL